MALTATPADTLNNWGDALDKYLHLRLILSDNFTLSDALSNLPNISLQTFQDLFLITDELRAQFHHRLQIADNLNNLSDALNIVFGFLIEKADQIVLSDSASVNNSGIGALTLNLSDGLSMSDSLGSGSPLNSTSFLNYLRRYLNDVPTPES